MEDENHMRRNLRELLGSDIILRKKRLTKQSKSKQIFCEVLNDIKLLMERSYCLEHDYGISLEGWDEKFLYVVDGLLNLKFENSQIDLNSVSNGIYFIQIIHNNVQYNKRIIKE